MAAADLRAELSCSICLSIYTDPVSLPCGHNFCRDCIERTWDTQEGSGAYSCPECKEEYQERPVLYRNRTLSNIAERFRPTETEPERIYGQEATDLLLDINTAGNDVSVSGDRKSASYSPTDQHYPQTPERFQDYAQVLSSKSFSSGRHYWEVEVSESGDWGVGVAYPSIERKGSLSCMEENKKSWCLWKWENILSVRHYTHGANLNHIPSCRRIRISLDYEAGRLSFYELSEPIRHLHTFTATFTEPLHAAFWVGWLDTFVRIIS